MDLVCLVADSNMEATITQLFQRTESLGTRVFEYEVVSHPDSDPGCFKNGEEILNVYCSTTEHALVILDYEWGGVPASSGSELEDQLEQSLNRRYKEGWARAVVIEPELEAWVFSTSPHVARILGWPSNKHLRSTLASMNLWQAGQPKPSDPKAALEEALRRRQIARSSSIYRELAKNVSTKSCKDRAFIRMRTLLQDWFPKPCDCYGMA